jgi:hypothetical protein
MHPDQQEPPNKNYTHHMYIHVQCGDMHVEEILSRQLPACLLHTSSSELLRADLYSKVACRIVIPVRIFLPHKIMIKGSDMILSDSRK